MICLICRQAETVDRFTAVNFERGEMKLTVNNVPARVCPNCGEAYLAEHVAVKLLRHAEEIVKAGILNSALDFSAFTSTE